MRELSKIILITGVPGTGKSAVSIKLKKNLKNSVILTSESLKKAIIGYDKKRKCKIIDVKIYSKELSKFMKKYHWDYIIIESLFAGKIKNKNVITCFVLRTNEKELIKRLKKRGYSQEKIKENVEAELCNYCGQEAFENQKNVIEIDTTKLSAKKTSIKCLEFLKKIEKK